MHFSRRYDTMNITATKNIKQNVEQIRSHKFRMQELENTVDGLRAEIKSMQMERDEQATMADKEKTRIEQQNVTMRSKLNHSETERLASNMKVDNLLADIDTKDSLLRSYKKTIDEHALRIETLNTNYNDCVAKAAVIKEEFLNQISNESTAHEAAQRELTAQNDELLSKLYDREAIIRKLQRETSEFQIRSERKEHDIRKEMNLVIQEHKHMNHTLELECTDLKHQLRSSSDNFNNMAAQSEQEVDRIRNENSRIVREKEMLLNKIREAEQRYETTRKSEQDVKRNLSEKLFTTQQEVVRLQNIIKNNTTTHEQLNQTISKYENEINNQKNQLKKIETEHAQAVENMNRNSKEKMDNLMNAYKEKLRNVQEHYRKINEKEKKKSEAYKEKAIEAHNTNKILNSNIEAMQAMADL